MTSITFPLYDNLIKDLDKEEMSQKEQDKFMKLIKTFDTPGYEIIYILIICYQLETNETANTITNKFNYNLQLNNNNKKSSK